MVSVKNDEITVIVVVCRECCAKVCRWATEISSMYETEMTTPRLKQLLIFAVYHSHLCSHHEGHLDSHYTLHLWHAEAHG